MRRRSDCARRCVALAGGVGAIVIGVARRNRRQPPGERSVHPPRPTSPPTSSSRTTCSRSCCCTLSTWTRHHLPPEPPVESHPTLDLPSDLLPPLLPAPPRPDVSAMVVCLLVDVAFRGVITEYEAIPRPFLMEQHHLTHSTASFRISFIGLAALLIYESFQADRARLLGPRASALRRVHVRGGLRLARRARRLESRIRARVRRPPLRTWSSRRGSHGRRDISQIGPP